MRNMQHTKEEAKRRERKPAVSKCIMTEASPD